MAEETSKVRWLPLESNPDVMNKYIKNLGASSEWGFHDVYGFDAELLMIVPKPVAAVMLLYPITEQSEKNPLGTLTDNKNLYFMKQTVGNACGTVGIIHALANNKHQIKLDDSKSLASFLKNSESMDKDARADALGKDETIGAAHASSALEGQTEAPDINEKITLHFVAFVHCDGGLYEMDGRKDKPTRHGDTTPETLLEDTVAVVKQFMARDPENLNFTVTVLAQN